METTPKDARGTGSYVVAALLIVIGGAALAANLTGATITPLFIPLGIGLAFLVAYVFTRKYGFLVPAGVLTGFGCGAVAASMWNFADSGALIVVAGGLGFLIIYVVDILMSGSMLRWWPVIPGGILTMVGASVAADSQGLRQVGMWWPLLLIAFGLLILFGRRRPQSQ
jgi:hypothetical protein